MTWNYQEIVINNYPFNKIDIILSYIMVWRSYIPSDDDDVVMVWRRYIPWDDDDVVNYVLDQHA
jgi:hypothetical protein